MNRHLALLLLFVLFMGSLPVAAEAANLPLLDPDWHLVPDPSELDESCSPGAPLGFAGTLQLIQNVMNGAVSLGIVIFVLVIMFSGVLWILTSTNPENHSQAKKMLTNAVVGFLIMLSGWIIVDFVMKTLYDGDTAGFGPWNTILVGGDFCITAPDEAPPGLATGITQVPGGSGGYAGGPASVGYGNCAPSTILSAAAAGGYRITQAQANTLSCIAKPESSCGTNISGARTVDGRPTTAHGMFQIVMGYNDKCHNLNIPVCTQAAKSAGWTGTGNLNCSTAFSGGRVKAGMEELARVCRAAAANLTCNVSAAACLLKERPSFSDWTADPRSTAQKACVARFSGG
ncbi:pilin [Patescibacteria group bacterium]|nr:pilin [Patescibacteria group bacterium]MBU1500809.1 pilin [Patescibacteria group bacterium]MBU2080864.1 pilin [Patescibacteria group bacterium]MBU2123969.1 pilin [Patescibacteria group bacterium]MBU2194740.1 pilin [Patescibacteria group bacterium]